jgi:hypothetical protein
VKAAVLLSHQEPCEARWSSLPAGLVGSSLLDVLEVLDRARKAIRTAAKGMLVKSPNSLPGWMVAMPNGRRNPNAGLEWQNGAVRVQEHRRTTSLKLVQRRTAGSALQKGNQTTP